MFFEIEIRSGLEGWAGGVAGIGGLQQRPTDSLSSRFTATVAHEQGTSRAATQPDGRSCGYSVRQC